MLDAHNMQSDFKQQMLYTRTDCRGQLQIDGRNFNITCDQINWLNWMKMREIYFVIRCHVLLLSKH